MSPRGVTRPNGNGISEQKIKLWFLGVGVNKCKHKRLGTLKYAASDCQGMAEAIAGVNEDYRNIEMFIHHDDDKHKLQQNFHSNVVVQASPIVKEVISSLRRIEEKATEEDIIFFYFSGHGEIKDNQVIFCLADSTEDNLSSIDLSLEELLRHLNTSKAKTKIIVLDACHSGATSEQSLNTNSYLNPMQRIGDVLNRQIHQSNNQSSNFYALMSCGSNQKSYEFEYLQGGLFTYNFIRGLESELVGNMGDNIDIDRLFEYVSKKTSKYINDLNDYIYILNKQKSDINQKDYINQTPEKFSRITGGDGVIIGKKKYIGNKPNREALIIQGISNSKNSLQLSTSLNKYGVFNVNYLPKPNQGWSKKEVEKAIEDAIKEHRIINQEVVTVKTTLLYIKGYIEIKSENEARFILGGEVYLDFSWLKEALLSSTIHQQIVILDCFELDSVQTVVNVQTWLEEWVNEINETLANNNESQRQQYLIAAISPREKAEKFSLFLGETLKTLRTQQENLTVVQWIKELTTFLDQENITWIIRVSNKPGVTEILLEDEIAKTRTSDLGFSPYKKGLKTFDEKDFQYYYGRDTDIDSLLTKLRERNTVAVVGASGSGKSSLVKAGLIPSLRQGNIEGSDRWWICIFELGDNPLWDNPLRSLARSLTNSTFEEEILLGHLYCGVKSFDDWLQKELKRRNKTNLLLILDQFEQLLYLKTHEETEKFLDVTIRNPNTANNLLKVVLTLRADFFEQCLEFQELLPILNEDSNIFISSLSREQYRDVVVKPAEQVGLTVESDLQEKLLDEFSPLKSSPGNLALFEFVLQELWERRQGGVLKRRELDTELFRNALNNRINYIYTNFLHEDEQRCAKSIFLKLTYVAVGIPATRQRLPKSQLEATKDYPQELIERTLKKLIDENLIVASYKNDNQLGTGKGLNENLQQEINEELEELKDEVSVEIVHDILFQHWDSLKQWVKDNEEQLELRSRIDKDAKFWKKNNYKNDYLNWEGEQLEKAEKYLNEYGGSELTKPFIQACIKKRNWKRKIQRVIFASIITLVITIIIASLQAYSQSLASQVANIELLNSNSENYLSNNQQIEALIASVKATNKLQNMKQNIFIHQVLADTELRALITFQKAVYETQEINRLEGHSKGITSINFNSNGEFIASGSNDGTIKIWNQDGKLQQTNEVNENNISNLSFNPNNQTIAFASLDGNIKTCNFKNGKLKNDNCKALWEKEKEFHSVAFNSNGTIIAAASRDGKIKLWNFKEKKGASINAHTGRIYSMSFGPNKSILASAGEDNMVKLWNVDTKELIENLEFDSVIKSVNFSKDGTKLVAFNDKGKIKLWYLAQSRKSQDWEAHDGEGINSVSFNPSSTIIASGRDDNTVQIWNLQEVGKPTLIKTLQGHIAPVTSVSFHPDKNILASAGGNGDNTIKIWNVDKVLESLKVNYQIDEAIFSRDGKLLALVSLKDGSVKLWGFDSREKGYYEQPKQLPSNTVRIKTISFSPDGRIIALGKEDGSVELWYSKNRKNFKTLAGNGKPINSISFNPKNQNIIAAASDDFTINMWDLQHLKNYNKPNQILSGHKDAVTSISFSPNGKMLASGSKDGKVKLWNLLEYEEIQSYSVNDDHTDWVYKVDFSPDGKLIASASKDNSIKIWDTNDMKLTNTVKHTNEVKSVIFSPDGRMIVSASKDETVKFWNRDGIFLNQLTFNDSYIKDLNMVSIGENKIAATKSDNTIIMWNFDTNNLLNNACKQLHDYLNHNPNGLKEKEVCQY